MQVLKAPEKGQLWFTSDTHFFHANIIQYCDRPFASVEEMNEVMVQRWNERVAPEDTVIHLGDFALGRSEAVTPFRKRLNGAVVLVRGNHDRFGRQRAAEWGFQSVVEGEAELTLGGRTFVLAHHPEGPPVAPGRVRLCGHVHNNWRLRGGVLNVGVDVWDFRPISIDEVVAGLTAADEGWVSPWAKGVERG
jgi:calcineurin-like phosphoesterase family protein